MAKPGTQKQPTMGQVLHLGPKLKEKHLTEQAAAYSASPLTRAELPELLQYAANAAAAQLKRIKALQDLALDGSADEAVQDHLRAALVDADNINNFCLDVLAVIEETTPTGAGSV